MIIPLNQEIIDSLTRTELEIVRFINNHEADLHKLSIVDIAMDTYSSPSTVSRAIRKCGIAGFNELRYKNSLKETNESVLNVSSIMDKSLVEAQAVIEQLSVNDILKVINILKYAKRIYVVAMGLSGYVAEEFALKLQLLGLNAVSFVDGNIIMNKAREIKSDECLFIYSLHGNTREVNIAAMEARKNGALIISCVCNDNSELVPLSDVNLIGFKHAHVAISRYEVSSRVPLHIIQRIIIDYIANEQT